MKLSLLDVASLAVDAAERPATFSILLHLRSKADLEVLREGARRAMGAFPRSSCHVEAFDWIANPAVPVIERVSSESELREFVSGAVDPSRFPLIEQRVFEDPATGGSVLATRMHHALGDGVALLLWLSVQLGGPIPSGSELRLRQTSRRDSLPWKKTEKPVSSGSASSRAASRQKRWRTLWLDEASLRTRLRDGKAGMTLNDLLCAWIFAGLRSWCGVTERPLSLWLPLSVRRDPFSYFGNASSRIRILESTDPLEIRQRVEEAMAAGGWDVGGSAAALPERRWLSSWMASCLKTGLRLYFARPGMDPCTTAFSFASRVSRADDADAFPGVVRIETVGHLYHAHPFAFSATSFAGSLGLTLFWDPAQLDDAAVERLFAELGSACARGEAAL